MRTMRWLFAPTVLTCAITGCTDRATFVTSTDIGLSANAGTQEVQIGFNRAELFQGPNYPDTGETPQVVGFMGSDLTPFAPHIRQLYATGDAADLVTAPGDLQACTTPATAVATIQYNLCPQAAGALDGERRPLVFATDTNLGFKIGFTSGAPSSIKFGYNREEISIIPLHSQNPVANLAQDKYTPVLASIEVNGTTASFQSTDLKSTQFFATGSAARNLAKNTQIRSLFEQIAQSSVNASLVSASQSAITQSQKDIDAYFTANQSKAFGKVRDTLLNNPSLAGIAPGFSSDLKSASSATAFDKAVMMPTNATFIAPISAVAKSLPPVQ